LDLTIRTWDLPTGYLIDAFKVPDICTSLQLSPVGDFLATTHVNHLGIFLWSNRAQYEHVPLMPLTEKDVHNVSLPTLGGLVEEINETYTNNDVMPEWKGEDWTQLDDELITLSSLPKSNWQNLLNLESIKVCQIY
jgi:U3 small nucleolar RNA-associated protein 21